MSADHAVPCEVRLYDHLFKAPDPDDVPEGGSYRDHLNPGSLEVLPQAWIEPSMASAAADTRVQFERLGYFCADAKDSAPGKLVFNRSVTLADAWAKLQKKQ